MKNRLAEEKSPYLIQHADNPVDWFPWCEGAFEKAKKEDKPIFLSIGYSTCHWCHVMAHESFEDEEVARLMNETFVSIKVDREERPDIDQIYMKAAHMMTGSGGWPLNVILTPDKKPFYAATYIPKEKRFGRPGMLELIPKIKHLWKDRREKLLSSAEDVTHALSSRAVESSDLDISILHSAFKTLDHSFDSENGGFGGAPKFPSSHTFLFLLRYWDRTGDDIALEMVKKTMMSMRSGGIFDHIGLGFHRYSTDTGWLLPHFEKMLYDQAMISLACLEIYQATKEPFYAGVAEEIFSYVTRDMQSSEGGFYSAEDADSEGEEGKYYLWTKGEIKSILNKKEFELFTEAYNIKKEGNYRDESTGRFTGKNVLHQNLSIDELSLRSNITKENLERLLAQAREKLFYERNKRVKPDKDDKILADWNGLMIASLARGSQVLDEIGLLEKAERGMEFVLSNMKDDEGRLLHRYRDGTAGIMGNLDDHAFIIWALLELYEASFKTDHLKMALELNKDVLERFMDNENSGFYFTPDDGEDLIVRNKEIYDGAMPSGNSVTIFNLLKLSRITGDMEFDKIARKALGS